MKAPATATATFTATIVVLACAPPPAFAWGSFGHRVVAETAALLVEDDQPAGLGNLLARHRFELGVYAFRPDSTFRHHDGKSGALEAPLHFLSTDALTMPMSELDVAFAEVDKKLAALEEKGPIGRVPWRIDQLHGMIAADWLKVPAVFGTYQRGETADEPQKSIFRALFHMGVLAHYTGDIAVPHHASKDSNSFHKNQGGLHFYFEGDCVEVFEPDLANNVLKLARKQKKAWTVAHAATTSSPVRIALSVLQSSVAALPAVEKADKESALLAASVGQSFAKRKPAAQGCKALRQHVEERLALGAVITAALWQRAVPSGVDWQRVRTLQFNDIHETEPFIAFP